MAITEKASELGIEMFVLDDGWFGKRNDDTSSLGDWSIDKNKLPGGLNSLVDKIKIQGMTFGIWVEPEMISPNSDLYKMYPDWAIAVPGRTPHKGRHQFVLDLSKEAVCNYLIQIFSQLFSSADIRYVKWDMNRNMTDIYSNTLSADRQGEVAYRYMLGLYRIMNELTDSFPHIIFEGCSGGGGRFDPGILHYMPQMWASDDTDAIERMYIQYATSIVYPASSICAQVSDVPNHQVGRVTPMTLRGHVAMSGMFGYSLNLAKISEEDESAIKEQVQLYKKIRHIIQKGDQYRLINPFDNRSCSWMFVDEDKNQSVIFYFNKLAKPNAELRRLKLKGLDENKIYLVDGKEYAGSTLMHFGLYLPENEKDFESKLWVIKAVE